MKHFAQHLRFSFGLWPGALDPCVLGPWFWRENLWLCFTVTNLNFLHKHKGARSRSNPNSRKCAFALGVMLKQVKLHAAFIEDKTAAYGYGHALDDRTSLRLVE